MVSVSAACGPGVAGPKRDGGGSGVRGVNPNLPDHFDCSRPRPLWEAWFSTTMAILPPSISAAVWRRWRRISVGILHRYHRLWVKGQLNLQEKQRFSK